MGKSRIIPLARGLISGEKEPIYGQFEISLANNKDVKIIVRRNPYSGRSDVKFSVPCSSFQSIIDVLYEAKEKLDEIWLSRIATTELRAKKKYLKKI